MRKSKGYTLIDALLVAAIVSILIAICVPAIQGRHPAQFHPQQSLCK